MMAWMLLLALAQATGGTVVTVARGAYSGIHDSKEAVIRAAPEWRALWKSHAGPEAAPVVDFSTDIVAAVFLGTRSTGGFSVEIIGARRESDVLIVEYIERRPGPDDIVTQVLTSPFHIVKVPRHAGPVRFREVSGR